MVCDQGAAKRAGLPRGLNEEEQSPITGDPLLAEMCRS